MKKWLTRFTRPEVIIGPAESPRMTGLRRIPTPERRRAAVQELLRLAR